MATSDYNLHEEFHWLSNGKELRVQINFNRDSYSWGTGQQKQIGYEGSYTPCKRGDGWMETGSDDAGSYECLLPAERKSKKRLDEAKAALKSRIPFIVSVFERKLNPGTITYGEVIKEGYTFDASGIDGHEHNFLWAKSHPAGLEVYYPAVQILGKTKEMVAESKMIKDLV